MGATTRRGPSSVSSRRHDVYGIRALGGPVGPMPPPGRGAGRCEGRLSSHPMPSVTHQRGMAVRSRGPVGAEAQPPPQPGEARGGGASSCDCWRARLARCSTVWRCKGGRGGRWWTHDARTGYGPVRGANETSERDASWETSDSRRSRVKGRPAAHALVREASTRGGARGVVRVAAVAVAGAHALGMPGVEDKGGGRCGVRCVNREQHSGRERPREHHHVSGRERPPDRGARGRRGRRPGGPTHPRRRRRRAGASRVRGVGAFRCRL